jgi:hypothetical protein
MHTVDVFINVLVSLHARHSPNFKKIHNLLLDELAVYVLSGRYFRPYYALVW